MDVRYEKAIAHAIGLGQLRRAAIFRLQSHRAIRKALGDDFRSVWNSFRRRSNGAEILLRVKALGKLSTFFYYAILHHFLMCRNASSNHSGQNYSFLVKALRRCARSMQRSSQQLLRFISADCLRTTDVCVLLANGVWLKTRV